MNPAVTDDQFSRWESAWRRQCFRYDPVFGWWHIANVTARLGLGKRFHRFASNSDGLREDVNYPRDNPGNRKRVIALGDSYTAGDGVSNGRRFTDLLDEAFADVDVMNFAVNGSGTDQQLLIYEQLANAWQADAIVWFFCVENIARNLYTCFPSYNFREHRVVLRPKPYFELNDGGLTLHNSPVPNTYRSAEEIGDWRYEFPYLADHPADPYAIYQYSDRPHWQLMAALIGRLIDGAAGRPVFLVPLPMYQHYLEESPPTYLERFEEIASPARGVHLINVLPTLLHIPLARRSALRFENDPHYTEWAHSKIADCLIYQMKRLVPDLFQNQPTAQ